MPPDFPRPFLRQHEDPRLGPSLMKLKHPREPVGQVELDLRDDHIDMETLEDVERIAGMGDTENLQLLAVGQTFIVTLKRTLYSVEVVWDRNLQRARIAFIPRGHEKLIKTGWGSHTKPLAQLNPT